MKFRLRFVLAFVLLFSSLFLFVTCEFFQSDDETLLNEEALAVVNGEKIILSEFQNEVRRFLESFPELRSVYQEDPLKIKKLVIDRIIRRELLLQEAVRRRLEISDEDLDNSLANALTPYAGANTRAWLKNANLNSEEWKQDQARFTTLKKLVQQEVNSKIKIPRSEVDKYYKQHPKEFRTKLQYNVRHILVNSKETADLIYTQLKRRRANFQKLVETHSISADKASEGNLGYIEKGVLPYESDQAVFKMKRVGELTPIIRSPYGFHIFKLLGMRKPQKMKLNDDLRKKIANKLAVQRREEAYEEWYDRIRRKSNITIDRNLLNKDQGF